MRYLPFLVTNSKTIYRINSGQAVLLNSVEWSQAENGDPLVCVSGNRPQIKVLNVKSGELVMVCLPCLPIS